MIKLASPDIRADDIEQISAILQSGNLVQGPHVQRFETALVDYTGIRHCAAVSSGTSALHLALLAVGVRPNDVVLVPAFTFPATANAAEVTGGRVVFCDVDPYTYVATPDRVLAAISAHPKIRAIMLVHEFGYPAAAREISEIAQRSGAMVIEDAACALGTVADGNSPGRFTAAACYSFHPRKAITTGEGGAVMSMDGVLVEKVRRLRNHGIAYDPALDCFDFVDAGLNYRLTDFAAALGNTQLGRFDRELEKRRAVAARYRSQLATQAKVALPAPNVGHSWQTFMITLDETVNRDAVRSAMYSKGIECGLGAQALNCLAYFRNKYGLVDSSFPNATRLYKQGLALPVHGRLSDADVDRVCQSLDDILALPPEAPG